MESAIFSSTQKFTKLTQSSDLERSTHFVRLSHSPKNLSRRGWIPNYHGAWAMIVIPPLLGTSRAGWTWIHGLLILSWVLGFFCFYAVGQLLRSHGKTRYRLPVYIYGSLTALAGIIFLYCYPAAFRWGLIFLPLAVISFWESWHRRDRHMLNNLVTITAAVLLLPLAYEVGNQTDWLNWRFLALPAPIWLITLIVWVYFMGTVWHAKTQIRQRGSGIYLVISLLYHWLAASLVLGGCLFASDLLENTVRPLLLLLVSIGLAGRATVMGIISYRRRHANPVQPGIAVAVIGMVEVVFSLIVFIALVVRP